MDDRVESEAIMTTMARELLRAVTERPVSAEWHRLANAFAEVDELYGYAPESEVFRRWHVEALRAVEEAFGKGSRHAEAFRAVEFSTHEPALTSFGRSDEEAVALRDGRAYREGLDAARAVLRAAMVEAGAMDAARLDAMTRQVQVPPVGVRVRRQTVAGGAVAGGEGGGGDVGGVGGVGGEVQIEHRLRKPDNDPMNDYEEWKSGVPT